MYTVHYICTHVHVRVHVPQGFYRRASANMALGKFKLALKDFEAVKKAKPRDPDAIAKYNACNKIVTQQAFERAIAVESSKRNIAESIDLSTMGKSLWCNRYVLSLTAGYTYMYMYVYMYMHAHKSSEGMTYPILKPTSTCSGTPKYVIAESLWC